MALTYAIGDVHGCDDKLAALISHCERHARGQEIRFVFLGDYVDRGPDTAAVVRRLMRMDAVCLMGNHEDLLLAARDGGDAEVRDWMANGAAAALRSWGVDTVHEIPAADIAWIRALRLCHDDGRRFFVHAGIDFGRPLDDQDPKTVLWTRRAADGPDPGRLIVHGHTPQTSGVPLRAPYRLNLDTAAVLGGPLTAAAFTDDRTDPTAFLTDDGRVTPA
jgi:serine/threonine protein phosphatase 1